MPPVFNFLRGAHSPRAAKHRRLALHGSYRNLLDRGMLRSRSLRLGLDQGATSARAARATSGEHAPALHRFSKLDFVRSLSARPSETKCESSIRVKASCKLRQNTHAARWWRSRRSGGNTTRIREFSAASTATVFSPPLAQDSTGRQTHVQPHIAKLSPQNPRRTAISHIVAC